jgi:predicted metalloprotease
MTSRPAFVGGGLGTIVLVLLALYVGVDPTFLLQNAPVGQVGEDQPVGPAPGTDGATGQPDPAADFISVVLADTEDTWTALFAEGGQRYEVPKLVLFSGSVQSACGFAQAAMGPFYCPADRKVYIDLSFYRDLKDRFQAPGDFAQAYVIAHEIGHHVQNLLGLSDKVQQARQRGSEVEANALSVRLELQADCFAGIWAHRADRTRQILETGDVDEALTAASAIGDDRLQQQSRGYVTPDSFTHGSAAQRVRWFRRGLDSGQLDACDTFASRSL